MPAEGIYVTISRVATLYYFSFFLIIMPLLSKFEKAKTLPSSIASSVLSDKFDSDASQSFAK